MAIAFDSERALSLTARLVAASGDDFQRPSSFVKMMDLVESFTAESEDALPQESHIRDLAALRFAESLTSPTAHESRAALARQTSALPSINAPYIAGFSFATISLADLADASTLLAPAAPALPPPPPLPDRIRSLLAALRAPAPEAPPFPRPAALPTAAAPSTSGSHRAPFKPPPPLAPGPAVGSKRPAPPEPLPVRGGSGAPEEDVNEVREQVRAKSGAMFRTAAHVMALEGAHVGGLRKPQKARVSPQGGSTVRGGFQPPFVKKALENVGGPPPSSGPPPAKEGPLSARTLELLSLGPEDPLPEALVKCDLTLVESVCNDVLDQGGSVTWEDIAGQAPAKRLVNEMVVWPMLNPGLFQGARAPPKGLLLFGPPGTGKTLIGKAIASNIRATFFNISASSLMSKWIGEGERMVRALFAVAGHLQPSVIFIDEIDSLLSARKSDGEHESSRRLKTEFLVQMEGCDQKSADRRVLLIGATNRPEELDEAARRRLPKQLYIPLPCALARQQMIERGLRGVRHALTEGDLSRIVQRTAGYSGSDMRNLTQEACQGPVRDAVAERGVDIASLEEAALRPVGLQDFKGACRAQKASVKPEEVARYEAYDEKHGARYAEGGGKGQGAEEDDDW